MGRISTLQRQSLAQERALGCLAIAIDNLEHIGWAYGSSVQLDARSHARDTICALLRDMRLADSSADQTPVGTSHTLQFPLQTSAAQAERWLKIICEAVARNPLETSYGPVHICVSGELRISGQAAGSAQAERLSSGEPGSIAAWRSNETDSIARYRADMALVADFFASTKCDAQKSLGLAWQPICDARGDMQPLYQESLLRVVDKNGEVHSLARSIGACERLGFIRIIDHHVAICILSELNARPELHAGINISAHSARIDAWWSHIFTYLYERPDIARRLIIEITETAEIPNVSSAVDFASKAKFLGCKVAIDDFGAGYSSLRNIIAISPSIVKIDKIFIRRASSSFKDLPTFEHLVGLAQSLNAATVIVEGIETSFDSHLALAVGARWQQGSFHGQPSLPRPCSDSGEFRRSFLNLISAERRMW